jgi:DNA-binding IclR family transcriptional regulator
VAAVAGRKVLAKVGQLLDELEREDERTVAELSAAVGEPRSTIYRLLAGLRELGMVDPGRTRGSFRLGLRFMELGSQVQARLDERAAALPGMRRLHDETGETVFLTVRRGFEAVCIERIEGRRVQVLALSLGGSLPLHLGAAPRVLLAFAPEELQDEYLKSGKLERVTPNSLTKPRELREDLARIRERGLAISDEDVTLGIAALGAPIRDRNGGVVTALSVAGVRPAILGDDVDRISGRLREEADVVSRQLGWRGEP